MDERNESAQNESAQNDSAPNEAARSVYGIAVAAELSGVGEQTLRLYERKGLLTPDRTPGGTRRYSEDDLTDLRRIAVLVAAGVNLVGIRYVMELELRNARLESRVAELTAPN